MNAAPFSPGAEDCRLSHCTGRISPGKNPALERIEVYIMKKTLAFILCLAMVASLAVCAGAESVFLHPFTRVDDSSLYLSGLPIEDGTVSVTVNGQLFDHCTVTTVEESALPLTYYCVVDQSSSLSQSQRRQQLQALTALNDAMRPNDSMVLVNLHEDISFGEPLTTREAREQAITQACNYTAQTTSLNASLVKLAQTVAAARDDKSLSCILLITDGMDDAIIPASQEEAYQAIRSTGLSLCTVALVDPWAEGYNQRRANQLAEYAAQSLGGFSVIPSRNNYDSPTCVEDSMKQVLTHVLSGSVLSLDVRQLPTTANPLEIEITWQHNGTRTVDQCSVDAALLPAPTEPPQPETTAPPETTVPVETTAPAESTAPTQPETLPTETTPPAPVTPLRKNATTLMILLAAGFVLLIILIVLSVLLWRKQHCLEEPEKPQKQNRRGKAAPAAKDGDWENLDISEMTVQKNRPEVNNDSAMNPSDPWVKPIPQAHSCKVHLVPESRPEESLEFTIEVNEGVTLGRTKRSTIILNETDTALSGIHFELQWDSRVLHLRDRRSTNGTALNDVPLRAESWVRVENKAIIQAGSDRYTIFVEKK